MPDTRLQATLGRLHPVDSQLLHNLAGARHPQRRLREWAKLGLQGDDYRQGTPPAPLRDGSGQKVIVHLDPGERAEKRVIDAVKRYGDGTLLRLLRQGYAASHAPRSARPTHNRPVAAAPTPPHPPPPKPSSPNNTRVASAKDLKGMFQ